MGGQTAFGYEQEDGTVIYALTFTDAGLQEIIPYIDQRTVDGNHPVQHRVNSVEAYFLGGPDEDVCWRVLYRLDGTAICRAWMTKYDVVFQPRK